MFGNSEIPDRNCPLNSHKETGPKVSINVLFKECFPNITPIKNQNLRITQYYLILFFFFYDA